MEPKTVALAGGSGFIGRAIARRLVQLQGFQVRILTRNPDAARVRLGSTQAELSSADVTDPRSLKSALKGAAVVINAAQFDGYPIENTRRGLTFERIDYGGTVALLDAARGGPLEHFVYISGAAADARGAHPAFRAKGMAEQAIRESGTPYTIFRPSLVFGPEDRLVNVIAAALRFVPVFLVPGNGRQKVQPVFVEDLAESVALALTSGTRALGRVFDVGGPDLMTLDELIQLVMELTDRRRPLVHIPVSLLRFAGALAEMLPTPLFSRDAVTFVTADNACDVEPLIQTLGVKLTPPRQAMTYLAANR